MRVNDLEIIEVNIVCAQTTGGNESQVFEHAFACGENAIASAE